MRAEDLLQKAYSDLVVAAQNLLMSPPDTIAAYDAKIETLRKPLADVLRAKGQGKAANNLERGVTIAGIPVVIDPKLAAGEMRLQTVEDARAAGAGSHANVPKATPRGVRNNNPGNIRKSADDWQGLEPDDRQTDPAFFRFTSAHFGIRAMARILLNYQSKRGLNTLRKLIDRWAPPVENNTSSYVNHVAAFAHVDPDAEINLRAPGLLAAIVTGMIIHENGGSFYPSAIIEGAVLDALRAGA